MQAGPAASRRVFDVRLAGLDHRVVACRDGVMLQPSVAAADVAAPDLVVVPGLDDELAASFGANRGWVPWLVRWHAGDPIDQVRRRAGYGDPAAFRRVFKQATGLSPSGYRDAYGLRAD
ncbi:MAG TPA: helix-turn-helix domain-containing protein [Streptosporangiaceae bacterium]